MNFRGCIVKPSYKKYFLFSITSLSIFLFSVQASHAFFDSGKDRASAEIVLDGRTYTRGDLIASLLTAGFSNRFWNDDVARRDGSSAFGEMVGSYMKDEPRAYEKDKKWHPWMADHIHRPYGWPASGVVNKWQRSKVSVAFGWPAYSLASVGDGRKSPSISPYNGVGAENFYATIEKAVLQTIPQISGQGIPALKFMRLGDSDDATENYARIRIVPTSLMNVRSPSNPGVDSYKIEFQERMFWAGVPLQIPDPLVEAYILPDHNNNIDLVICKIDISATEDDVYRVVPKCLVSALGLPELFDKSKYYTSDVQRDSLLAYDTVKGHQPDEISRTDGKIISVTEREKYLLKLLYCSAITSGMDKASVFRTLAESSHCW
ncbi:hypothetical protein [Micavibrio aeruginosavorus]|uniref:hypothetical protein n=1 Tax=Micavibrio aeruginosavorus TaxID=349221 RepID=UPI003F4A8A6D